jgi:Ca2+-binding RTX toxin-like protein
MATITGTSGHDTLLGTTSADEIYGLDGNDALDGGVGADTMVGGTGNDTYVVDDAGDVVTENASEGTDVVQVGFDYTLSANVENLVLSGSAGNGAGNSVNNSITGTGSANTLDGGAGVDTLIGGAGDDLYIVDHASDVVTENASEGIDTVLSSVTRTLGTNQENLVLSGGAAINGTGNTLNNVLTGNGAANSLNGSTGNDTMIGGDGNDIYVVGVAADVVTENDAEGTDTVQSSVTYTLGLYLEHLVLTGSSAITGTGNSLDNALTGNNVANTLTGSNGNDTLNGAGGADRLVGGLGDDTHVVDDAGDLVVENASEGTELVQSAVDYTLASNLENLILTTGALWGTGNTLDNVLTGNSDDNWLGGSSGNDTLDGGAGVDALEGGTGDDTYVVDNASDVVTEAASSGTDTVRSSVTRTLGTNQENLTLIGSSAINGIGNTLANVLTGNDAANSLNGSTGSDTMLGGLGNDIYVVDNASDVVTESASAGTDTVQVGFAYTLGTNTENLTLTGSSAITGTGNELPNVITGNTGANTLYGAAGVDTLQGGTGNDTYIVDESSDVIIENASAGTDVVQSSVDYTLSANVEQLVLMAGALHGTGSAGDNSLVGNTSANSLEGSAGNDTLDGGVGADTMVGGTGNDTYVVDDAGDVVTENASEGTDTVQVGFDYTLSANVENLVLSGSAGSGAGNSVNNSITGTGSANTLDGGAGVDTLIGGAGDDLYIVDHASDVVTENASEGIDTVLSSVTRTLGTNQENLVLSGGAAINGTGNTLNNVLTGNSAANSLNGSTGSDTMIGGDGDDIYVVGVATDVVTENDAEGTDTVQSSVTYTLGLYLEQLVLTGTSAISGTGNSLDNALTGNNLANTLTGSNGNDTLNGGGGADRLIGGEGDDVYYVDNEADVVVEDEFSFDNDIVFASVDYTSPFYVDAVVFEGSATTGTGNSGGDHLIASVPGIALYGNGGNDMLEIWGSGGSQLFGGTGDDYYFVASAADQVNENPSEGIDTIAVSIYGAPYSYTLPPNVENLILYWDAQTGTGNSLANEIHGYFGNNTLNGGAGADYMFGGPGDDTYVVDNAGDYVIEAYDEGIDRVQTSVSYTLEFNVENLILTGSASINGTGNSQDNLIVGNSGANILNGAAGLNTLQGAGGNDTYVVTGASDVVVENASAGTDIVHSSVDYTLGTNVENLLLTGTAVYGAGNGLNNILTGNSEANDLVGNEGDDTLDGFSGLDTLEGGGGNDTYFVDDMTEVVVELESGGIDIVFSSVDIYPYYMGEVENFTLLDGASDAVGNGLGNVVTGNSAGNSLRGDDGNDTLFGNAGNDYLVGNAGSDYLVGGIGNDTFDVEGQSLAFDTMEGGAGNDVYLVEFDSFVVITELSGQGTDTLLVVNGGSVLDANVENLVLFTGGIGTGNSVNNNLAGNSSANTLSGLGGNDTLLGDSGADALYGGNGNDLLDGGSEDDVLFGEAGNDLLVAGSGHDTLAGGSGSDAFVFDIHYWGVDSKTVSDFESEIDRIVLDRDAYPLLDGLGVEPFYLPIANFVANPGAIPGDSNDYVLYDTDTGALYYTGEPSYEQPVQIAILTGAPTLTATDIQIVA